MVAVAIAGIHFAAIRALFDGRAGVVGAYLLLGALPMADVLVVGMLIARQRSGSRPFLLGFEVFGALALALYIVEATCSGASYGPLDWYVSLVLRPLIRITSLRLGPMIPAIRPYGLFVRNAIDLFVGIVMLVGPQLVFALIGGILSRRYKITITPR
jgi:hypothetical protein